MARMLVLLFSLMLGVGCAPQAHEAREPAASEPRADTRESATEPAREPATTDAREDASPPATMPRRTGGPNPPRQVERPGVALDFSCRTDADCTVKDIGNCCGTYPQCVNVDSPTDPKAVQEECRRKGMASTCGFQQLSGCQCVQNRCRGISADELQAR